MMTANSMSFSHTLSIMTISLKTFRIIEISLKTLGISSIRTIDIASIRTLGITKINTMTHSLLAFLYEDKDFALWHSA